MRDPNFRAKFGISQILIFNFYLILFFRFKIKIYIFLPDALRLSCGGDARASGRILLRRGHPLGHPQCQLLIIAHVLDVIALLVVVLLGLDGDAIVLEKVPRLSERILSLHGLQRLGPLVRAGRGRPAGGGVFVAAERLVQVAPGVVESVGFSGTCRSETNGAIFPRFGVKI